MAIRKVALVLFGGSGERFGGNEPKQFALLADKPMMVETLTRLSSCPEIEEIYVVSRHEDMKRAEDLLWRYRVKKVKAILGGGASREESVFRGLCYLKKIRLPRSSLVLIHDGDRPNVSPTIVKRNFEEAGAHGAAVTAIPATSSVFESVLGYEVDRYANRQAIYLAQTPQTFRFSILESCFAWAAKKKRLDDFTDDASLVKSRGYDIRLVPGDPKNVKITTRFDLALYYEGRLHP